MSTDARSEFLTQGYICSYLMACMHGNIPSVSFTPMMKKIRSIIFKRRIISKAGFFKKEAYLPRLTYRQYYGDLPVFQRVEAETIAFDLQNIVPFFRLRKALGFYSRISDHDDMVLRKQVGHSWAECLYVAYERHIEVWTYDQKFLREVYESDSTKPFQVIELVLLASVPVTLTEGPVLWKDMCLEATQLADEIQEKCSTLKESGWTYYADAFKKVAKLLSISSLESMEIDVSSYVIQPDRYDFDALKIFLVTNLFNISQNNGSLFDSSAESLSIQKPLERWNTIQRQSLQFLITHKKV